MAKQSGLGQACWVGGYDLSGDIGTIQRAAGTRGTFEVTGIDKSAFERIHGRRDGELTYGAFFNPATSQAHPVLSALPTADQVTVYCLGTSLGSPAAGLIGKQINYDSTRSADGALALAVQSLGNGYALEWGELLTAGKRTDTAATNGTAVDGGTQAAAVTISTSSVANPTVITTAAPHGLITGDSAIIAGHTGSTPGVDGEYTVTVTDATHFTVPVNVSSGGTGGTVTLTSTHFGLAAYLEVFSVVGTSMTVKLQDSADNTTFADITGAAFTAVLAAARSHQRIETSLTATIRRYVRAITTGTFNPGIFGVAMVRNLTAVG